MHYESKAVKLYREGLTIEQVVEVIYQDRKNSARKGTDVKKVDIKKEVYEDIYHYYMTSNVLSVSS